MKNSLLIILLTLAIGIAGGFFVHKMVSPRGYSDMAKFQEIIRVKELHLIKHIYQDISFIHRKNDPSKALRAIAIVPVEVSAFINLKEMEIVTNGDSIVDIVLPQPELNDPNYKIDKMEVKNVRNIVIYVGKDLYAEVLKYMKDIAIRRKDEIVKLSVSNGIMHETKTEAVNYITSLLKGLGMNQVPIRFKEDKKSQDSQEHPKPELKTNENVAYNPEFISVTN